MSTDDPIAALADTLDALDEHLTRSESSLRRSESNRLGMLHLHAAAAVVIATLFAALDPAGMTGATWAILREVPGMPTSLAGLLGAGGVILGVGTWHRHLLAEVVGLTMLLAWYVIIAASFAGAALMWVAGATSSDTRPAMYASMVYAHLAAIMAVHLRTLRRMRRRRR